MQIIISNDSSSPIYEQIVDNIKSLILSGEIVGGEDLPSIRSLAKDLRISVITTKRAYEELERDGFIETIPGKGSIVKGKSDELLKEEIFKKIEDYLSEGITIAKSYKITKKEIEELYSLLLGEIYDEK